MTRDRLTWRPKPHARPHRTLPEIYALIDGSRLSGDGQGSREGAVRAAWRASKGPIHGTPLDKVHLHEVGALDSIVDIVSAVHALELLGADRIVASPLNVGSGTIRSAHGLYPVPAPATVRLLEGAPIYSGHAAGGDGDAYRCAARHGVRDGVRRDSRDDGSRRSATAPARATSTTRRTCCAC